MKIDVRTLCFVSLLLLTILIVIKIYSHSLKEDADHLSFISKPLLDVGAVIRGHEIPFQFEIRNNGNSTLQILSVSPSCSCTDYHLTKYIVPAGTSSMLNG